MPGNTEKEISERIQTVGSFIQIRITILNRYIKTHSTSIFKYPNVAKDLSYLPIKYVTALADKAPNNMVFMYMYKSHYIQLLDK